MCDGHEWEVVRRKTAGCGHLGRCHQLSGKGVGEVLKKEKDFTFSQRVKGLCRANLYFLTSKLHL